MASISSPNVIQGTGDGLDGLTSFAGALFQLSQIREQKYQSDRKVALDQIDSMAKEANLPLNMFLRDQKGRQAVMAFAPKLFRGINARKQAEDWINAYTSVGLESSQVRKAMEDAFVRGDIQSEIESIPGQAPDWQGALAQYDQQRAASQGGQGDTPGQASGLASVQPQAATQGQSSTSQVQPGANDELNAAFERTKSNFIKTTPIQPPGTPRPIGVQYDVIDPLTGQIGQYPDGSPMSFSNPDQAAQAYRGLLYKFQEQRGGYGGQYKGIVDQIFTPTAEEIANRNAAAAEAALYAQDAARRAGGSAASSQGAPTSAQGQPGQAAQPVSTPASGSPASFRQFLLEKAKVVPGINIDPNGTESDEQLMAKSPRTRLEYEAYKRGIAPAWAKSEPQSQVAAVTGTPASANNDLSAGNTSVKFTEEEANALRAYGTATDPSQLTTKDQILFNRALSKIGTQGRKEKITLKLTPEGRARLNQTAADAVDTALTVLSPDSEMRNDPRFSHLFENPTQLGIDLTKGQIRYQQVMTDKALQDMGFAGEELALKKRQIAALEVSNEVDRIKAISPAYEKLVEAVDSSLSRYEEPIRKRLENVKTTKELQKAVQEIESTLLQIPGYKAEKEAWTKMIGNWSDLGVNPIEVALVKRGWFGVRPSGQVAGTLALGGGGIGTGPVGDTAGESAYNDQAKQDILARYGR